jgi:uncharacterized membrane protein YidH (DUF202 family)
MRSRELGGEGAAQRERTDLAWQRSAFSFAALGGLVLGVAAHRDAPWLLAISVALLAIARGVRRRGRVAYERAEVTPQPRALVLLTAFTAVSALVAAVVVLVRL